MNCTHVTLAIIYKGKHHEKIINHNHIKLEEAFDKVFIKIRHAYRCVEKINSYLFKSNIYVSI